MRMVDQMKMRGFYRLSFILSSGLLVSLAAIWAFPALDLNMTLLLQSFRNPVLTGAMLAVSWPGFFPQSIVMIGVESVLLYLVRRRREAVVVLAASVAVQLVNAGIKFLVQRPRPSADLVDVARYLTDYSFPSGHVMLYTVFFGFNGFLAYTLLPRSWKRSVLLAVCGASAGLVGLSRIYLGAHWASDTAAAYLLGGAVLAAAIRIYLSWRIRPDLPGAAAPDRKG